MNDIYYVIGRVDIRKGKPAERLGRKARGSKASM